MLARKCRSIDDTDLETEPRARSTERAALNNMLKLAVLETKEPGRKT